MKKTVLILMCFLFASTALLKAQAPCDAVTVEAFAMDPQSGAHNYFGVRVTLAQAYSQDVAVSGYIFDDGNGSDTNHPFTLTITAGNLTEETEATFYQTDPTAVAAVSISSVTPCPSTSEPADLSYLEPNASEVITTGNSLYTSFVNATGVFQRYPSLTIMNQNLDLVTLADPNLKVMVISITGMGTPNKLVVVCNTTISEFMYYFVDYTENLQNQQRTAVVNNENNTLIYSTVQTGASFDISLSAPQQTMRAATCFSGCMDRQEENFESTFIGWLSWNAGPHAIVVQVLAASNCQGCCKGWWKNKGC